MLLPPDAVRLMPDTLYTVISDLHLGGALTRRPEVISFLRQLHTDVLVLNGDLFDADCGIEFPFAEVEIIDLINQLTCRKVRIPGNHDPLPWDRIFVDAETAANGRYVIESGGKRVLVLHGHVYDTELLAHPNLTEGTTLVERWLAHLSVGLARWLKVTFKADRHLPDVVRAGALAEEGFDCVIAGHTHVPETWPGYNRVFDYVNAGSWCENRTPTYVTVEGGRVGLHEYHDPFVA